MIQFNSRVSLAEAVLIMETMDNEGIRKLLDSWKDTKRCCRCKQWRKKSLYGPYKLAVDGLNGTCKMCDSKRNKAAYAKRKAKA